MHDFHIKLTKARRLFDIAYAAGRPFIRDDLSFLLPYIENNLSAGTSSTGVVSTANSQTMIDHWETEDQTKYPLITKSQKEMLKGNITLIR